MEFKASSTLQGQFAIWAPKTKLLIFFFAFNLVSIGYQAYFSEPIPIQVTNLANLVETVKVVAHLLFVIHYLEDPILSQLLLVNLVKVNLIIHLML